MNIEAARADVRALMTNTLSQ